MTMQKLAVVWAAGALACATGHEGMRVEGVTPAAGPAPVVIAGDTLGAGTQLLTQLDQPIGTDLSRVGQFYTATVAQPLVDPDGQPIVPAGAQVTGRVVALHGASEAIPARVGLSIDTLRVGDAVVPIAGHVIATDVQASQRGVQATHLVDGAQGGAVIGAILGSTRGAMGLGTSTLISLGLSDKNARLPQGTALAIQVDAPIAVAALHGFPHG
jgi:hypothetical protein